MLNLRVFSSVLKLQTITHIQFKTIKSFNQFNSSRNLPTSFSLRNIYTTPVNETFWEREKKSGYAKKLSVLPSKKMIIDGLQELKQEIALWKDEIKEKFESDPILVFRPGEIDVSWKFSGKFITLIIMMTLLIHPILCQSNQILKNG